MVQCTVLNRRYYVRIPQGHSLALHFVQLQSHQQISNNLFWFLVSATHCFKKTKVFLNVFFSYSLFYYFQPTESQFLLFEILQFFVIGAKAQSTCQEKARFVFEDCYFLNFNFLQVCFALKLIVETILCLGGVFGFVVSIMKSIDFEGYSANFLPKFCKRMDQNGVYENT